MTAGHGVDLKRAPHILGSILRRCRARCIVNNDVGLSKTSNRRQRFGKRRIIGYVADEACVFGVADSIWASRSSERASIATCSPPTQTARQSLCRYRPTPVTSATSAMLFSSFSFRLPSSLLAWSPFAQPSRPDQLDGECSRHFLV